LPEALARSRSDFVLSRPLRGGRKAGVARTFLSRLRSIPSRVLVGAGLSAIFAGVAVNALMLQSHRHPAPFFAPPPAASAPAAAGAEGAAPMSAAILPPPRPVPAPRAQTQDAATGPHAPATIDDLLNGDSTNDGSKLNAAAQGALVKLGYLPKTESGSAAAIQRAAREFERAHGLPQTAEITPRLVRQLTAAANAGGR
jgi:hypothetical protein